MAAVCVSVISKEVGSFCLSPKHKRRARLFLPTRILALQNFPLYLRTAPGHQDGEMEFHHIVHTAIDVIEEKISSVGTARAATDFRELYLGSLYPSEQFRMYNHHYGYATNTRVKFILITENTSSQPRDVEIKPLFRRLHAAYVDMFCNPFYAPSTEINSKKFDKAVADVIRDTKTATAKGE